MSPLTGGSQPDEGTKENNDGKRKRMILIAGLVGLALVSLLVLLGNPGLFIPEGDAIEDNMPEAEAADTDENNASEDVSENPVLVDTTDSNVESLAEDNSLSTYSNGFIGGYVSYPAEDDKPVRNGGSSQNIVEDPSDQGPIDDNDGVVGGGSGGNGGDDDDGSGEGCDVQYWQNHPENWPEPLTPATLFSDSNALGISMPGMEDLTLMDALALSKNLADELIREGTAGLLNSLHEEIDYPKSPPTVRSSVVDGLDPQIIQSEESDDNDMQPRKDKLQAANELVCPLL
jgi:hypothetical protein